MSGTHFLIERFHLEKVAGTSGSATAVGFDAFALGDNSTTIGSFAGAATPQAGVTGIGANANAIGATARLDDSRNYAIVANVGAGVGLERSVAGGRGAVSLQW